MNWIKCSDKMPEIGHDKEFLVKNTKKKHKTKKFIPCGEGDNICNCKSADECGYLYIKKEIAKL